MVIFCPIHKEAGEQATATRIATYDDEITGVEMVVHRCDEDSSHEWDEPSEMFRLRWIGWGPDWKHKRDKYRELEF